MEVATPAATSSQQNVNHGNSSGAHHGGPRRGQRGTRRGGNLSMRPATVHPPAATFVNELSSGSDSQRGSTRKPRGGRGNKSRLVNGREFGGNLTQAQSSTSDAQANILQPDAVEFVPGQQISHESSKAGRGGRRLQKRRFSKSQAPDIATRTHEDIDHSQYECPICTSEVQRNSKVWSCHTCWTVFHLTCIKKWSTNQGSTANQQSAEDGSEKPRSWRCPGCNLPKETLPKSYTCWCEKEVDPRSLAGLPPHSCGQSCGRERARKCPHPCSLICHAGPCPPCTHMGPTQMCFCGRHEIRKQCSETDYVAGWSCGEVCGEIMPCGEHSCPRPCHEGLCGACEVRIPAKCYCGQVEKDVLCAERGDEIVSHRVHILENEEHVDEQWTGIFECANACERPFDCGKHHCQKPCHAQDKGLTHCPMSPDVVTHCPCGKTALNSISGSERTSCDDPIASCDEPCGKTLPCGHTCTQICHTGSCSSCFRIVDITCRCGRTTSSTMCHQGQEEKPQCMRPCRTTLNCGRHACDERCCTGERKAIERQSQKRKQRPLHAARPIDDGFEAEHICTRQCGRLLKCGNHICEELCHRGPCGTCREAIFDEISCHCGRTVLQPPLPCGTEAPPCRYQCERLKACGHPQVPHACHGDDATCPKCPYLMEKPCMCGKRRLKNQQCWLQDVRCGEICGKKLRCGSHFCRKPCHRPGECEDAGSAKCQQPCGKPKKLCGHPDGQPCHAPFPCQEDKPCQSKIFITCECQAQKQESKCGACYGNEGNIDKKLPCNDECARLERNRKLALALNIDQSNLVDDHIPYSNETLKMFAANVKWAQMQEREYRVFATSDEERRMRFKPMKANERSFLHSLAEDFGFDSESMDPEPHRHVMIWKSPRFVSAPNKTLAEALRIRQSKVSIISAPTSDNEGVKKPRVAQTSEAVYNGFLVTRPRFALTIDELAREVDIVAPGERFDIEFLPSEEVVIKSKSPLPAEDVQQRLVTMKATLAGNIAAKQYGVVQLCSLDASLNVLRRESDSAAAQDGWSRVAAKKVASKTSMPSSLLSGSTNSFSALSGNKMTFSTKKKAVKTKAVEDVVDDWETAAQDEEDETRPLVASTGDERHPDGQTLGAESQSEADASGPGAIAISTVNEAA